jgi:hypothetical protein
VMFTRELAESFTSFCDHFRIPLFSHHREDFGDALRRDNGRFVHRLVGISWPRGDGKSLAGQASVDDPVLLMSSRVQLLLSRGVMRRSSIRRLGSAMGRYGLRLCLLPASGVALCRGRNIALCSNQCASQFVRPDTHLRLFPNICVTSVYHVHFQVAFEQLLPVRFITTVAALAPEQNRSPLIRSWHVSR